MDPTEFGRRFAAAVAAFPPGPILLLSHDDADGLSSAALLHRALSRLDRPPVIRLVGRGENAWSEATRTELATREAAALLVCDLGLRAEVLRAGTPTVVIDHHVTAGGLRSGEAAPDVLGLTGYGMEPTPTTSLLAYWCALGLRDAGMLPDDAVDDLLMLAAVGLIGDLGDKAPFPELDQARHRYGATALRNAVSLLNAARRSATGDGHPALAVLLRAETAKQVTSGELPGTEALLAAKREVADALDDARRVAPVVRDDVALLRVHSPCQIHGLLAQTWLRRLANKKVMVANTGFRRGWVNFVLRSAADVDLIAFLAEHRPDGADEQYGNGHRRASGGALPIPLWNRFIAELGFEDVATVGEELAA